MQLFNTLTRRVEPFVPSREGEVRMYTCGPTVYRPVHLGNLRSYLLADWLRRLFQLQGWRVVQVKNITDVGHMRQDAVDRGEDKVIAAALAEGRTPMEIAAGYEARFREDERALGILPATFYPRATEHVPEMIALTERLIAHGLAYESGGNVYYAVRRFPSYGRLSGNVQEALRQGVRADVDPAKREPADFALWKRAEPGRTALVWPSPWGEGYPGWHIECSAMSTRYLGEAFDLHTGGVDNIFPHHEDEIAQSEGALGHVVVGTWVHGQHLLADGVKMAKSARNTVEVGDLAALGIDPLAFRFQCLLTHYRARMHFSLAALRQAAAGLERLRQRVRILAQHGTAEGAEARRWREAFRERVEDDLDLPGALAVVEACARDRGTAAASRLAVILAADELLGLGLADVAREHEQVPADVRRAIDEHRRARAAGHRTLADTLRAGYGAWRVEDRRDGGVLVSRADQRRKRSGERGISSVRAVPDGRANAPDRVWSVCIVTRDFPDDVERCVASVLRWLPPESEVLVLDQGSPDAVARRVEAGGRDARVSVILADRDLGEGAGRNALLRLARGRLLLQLDPSVELTGDLFSALARALAPPQIGAAGPWGLRAMDHLKQWDEVVTGACDAVQGYCFATRREPLLAVGGFDERFRFYRNLDIAVSLALRARGLSSVAAGAGTATRHAHRAWERLPDEEREKRSRRNYDRLVRRFGSLGVGA
ncbi:MAG TPA: cysteine--tRNA ligase [Candidatus Limnocylindria bacterium]|nr:cysteine--tRNA ligase [Candidatus Limnocylindria bacterium]